MHAPGVVRRTNTVVGILDISAPFELWTGRLNQDTGLAMPRASAVPHAAPRVGTLPTQPDSEEVSTPGFHGHWRPRDHSPPCTRPASSLNAAPRCAR
jgi:hypothetical protein